MDDLNPEQNPELAPENPALEDLEKLQETAADFEPSAADIEQESAAESVESKQLVLMAISPLFDIFAPNWGVKDEEKEALAGAYGLVIDEYFPDIEANPIVGAVLVTGMVIAPRIGTPRITEQKKDDGVIDEASGD